MRLNARFRIKYWLQIGYNLPGLSFLSRLPGVRFRAGCADGRLVTGSRAGCYKLVTAPLGRFFRRPERGRGRGWAGWGRWRGSRRGAGRGRGSRTRSRQWGEQAVGADRGRGGDTPTARLFQKLPSPVPSSGLRLSTATLPACPQSPGAKVATGVRGGRAGDAGADRGAEQAGVAG